MSSANARLTHIIHTPARGSFATAPLESPTTTSSAHIPSENANRYAKPRTAERVVDTHVSTAAMTGAEQGAATSPLIAPITNVPAIPPPPPAVAARRPTQARVS